jgi:hypothetical protein
VRCEVYTTTKLHMIFISTRCWSIRTGHGALTLQRGYAAAWLHLNHSRTSLVSYRCRSLAQNAAEATETIAWTTAAGLYDKHRRTLVLDGSVSLATGFPPRFPYRKRYSPVVTMCTTCLKVRSSRFAHIVCSSPLYDSRNGTSSACWTGRPHCFVVCCFLYRVVTVPGYRSRGPGFDSRRCPIF